MVKNEYKGNILKNEYWTGGDLGIVVGGHGHFGGKAVQKLGTSIPETWTLL